METEDCCTCFLKRTVYKRWLQKYVKCLMGGPPVAQLGPPFPPAGELALGLLLVWHKDTLAHALLIHGMNGSPTCSKGMINGERLRTHRISPHPVYKC